MAQAQQLTTEDVTLLHPHEVATLFAVSPKTVARWARAGRIRAIRTMGGHRRFYADDVVEELRRLEARRQDDR